MGSKRWQTKGQLTHQQQKKRVKLHQQQKKHAWPRTVQLERHQLQVKKRRLSVLTTSPSRKRMISLHFDPLEAKRRPLQKGFLPKARVVQRHQHRCLPCNPPQMRFSAQMLIKGHPLKKSTPAQRVSSLMSTPLSSKWPKMGVAGNSATISTIRKPAPTARITPT